MGTDSQDPFVRADEALDEWSAAIKRRQEERFGRRQARLNGGEAPPKPEGPGMIDSAINAFGALIGAGLEASAMEEKTKAWGPFVREALVWWVTKRNHLEEFARAHRDDLLGREEQIRAEYHDRERPGHSGPDCARIAIWASGHSELRSEIERVLPFENRNRESLAQLLR